MDVVTLWYPAYWLDVMVKFFTAVISIFTAGAMRFVMPKAVALPSMAQLEDANRRLQYEVGERQRAEAALHNANEDSKRQLPPAPPRSKTRWSSGGALRKHCGPARSAGATCSRPPRSALP
jgi:hypothetical protein